MEAYSQDLRERVAAACAEPGAKIYQVAARFSVSLSFTDQLLRRQRTSGSVAELPRHPGPAPGRGEQPPAARLPNRATGCHAGRTRPGPGGGRRPLVAAQGRVAGNGTPRLGTQKKRPRRRTRHRTRNSLAPFVCRRFSAIRCYSVCVRGRDEHQPDLPPPLRPCPGRPAPGLGRAVA